MSEATATTITSTTIITDSQSTDSQSPDNQSAAPTPTTSAAAAAPAVDSESVAEAIHGPVAKAQSAQGLEWYLLGDGTLVASSNLLEPFPLPKNVQIHSIAQSSGPQNDLWAATDRGIFRRNAQSYRWSMVSDLPARYIAVAVNGIWITPIEEPDQLWLSQDEGISWQPNSPEQAGNVASPVRSDSLGNAWVVTQRDESLILWQQAAGAAAWTEIGDTAVAINVIKNANVSASFEVVEPSAIDANAGPEGAVTETVTSPAANPASVQLLAGADDGKLYQLDAEKSWQPIYEFGSGTYPILLGNNEVALLDSSFKVTRLYQGIAANESDLLPTSWQEESTPAVDLSLGIQAIPQGPALTHLFGWNDYAASGFAQMALAKDGALYRFDLDPAAPTASMGWRKVTDKPEQRDFVMTHNSDGSLGTFYSGAELVWEGATCTSDTTNFYRSDDQGASWTTVTSDKARRPLAILLGQAETVLAATCSGPELSFDGGATWFGGADMNWPYTYGAAQLDVRYVASSATATPQWIALYAAGVDENDAPFVLRSLFDAAAGGVGEWQTITPEGMEKPLALFAPDSGNSVLPLGNQDDLYVVDHNALWMSSDDGASWQNLPFTAGVARVVGIATFRPNAFDSGVLLATDKGLLMAPVAGGEGEWISLAAPFDEQAVDIQISSPTGLYINMRDRVYFLPNDFLAYQPGAAMLDLQAATDDSRSDSLTERVVLSATALVTGTEAPVAAEPVAQITDTPAIEASDALTSEQMRTQRHCCLTLY